MNSNKKIVIFTNHQLVGSYQKIPTDMVRTIITADKSNYTLSLPDDFLGKKVEVLAFVVEETTKKTASAYPSKTFVATSLDTKGFKFNREEANE